jgi:hypothetical protein
MRYEVLVAADEMYYLGKFGAFSDAKLAESQWILTDGYMRPWHWSEMVDNLTQMRSYSTKQNTYWHTPVSCALP